jgi:hypothetical protein
MLNALEFAGVNQSTALISTMPPNNKTARLVKKNAPADEMLITLVFLKTTINPCKLIKLIQYCFQQPIS